MPSPQTICRLLAELLRSQAYAFPRERGRLNAPSGPGVYLIYDPRGRLAHVGRSAPGKNGPRQRLRDHLQAQFPFTKEYLKGDGSKLRRRYKYKYLIILDPRERALVEAFAVGTLCPLHLGLRDTNR
jgi:hypothetical protein